MLVRRFVSAVCLAACAVGAFGGCTEQPSAPSAPADAPAPRATAVAGPTEPRSLRVLHAWDARRAAAYSRGDVAALRGLYVRGASAGEQDVAMLRRYVARGLTVEHLVMQVVEADVLVDRRGVVRLRVCERVADGRVTGAGAPVSLPRDRPDRHEVTLVRRDGRWLVRSATRAQVSAARP